MNAPISNYYDPENARQLVLGAAETYATYTTYGSYGSHEIENPATDTKAVITQATEEDLIVAFRGTRSLRNFVTDLSCEREPLFPGAAGEVHRGFKHALDSIFPELAEAVVSRLKNKARLWFTGHSLGGALAMLCAWRISNLKFQISNPVAGVYTFGQPRVGNAAFRDEYDALLKPWTFRVVDAEDFIPRIPWLLGAYRHSGTEVFYSSFSLQPSAFSLDPAWWQKGLSDLCGTWQEYNAAHRIAQLADHHVNRYVKLLSGASVPSVASLP